MKSAEKIVLDGLFKKLGVLRKSTEKRSIVEAEIEKVKARICLVSNGRYYPLHKKYVTNNMYGVAVQEPLFINAS